MSAAPGHAVFLSYASQDAEAARRIAEALSATDIEVWFDQNELVGGDAWDAKIRGQIASCALFVPVISAQTQTRLEGYFRLEWKLAAQRTHTMAEEKAFLLPIVIDDTRDAEAKVPAEFKAVQWTRAPSGETPVLFVNRVKQLLGGVEVGRVSDPPIPASGAPRAGQRPALPLTRRAPAARWAFAALGAVALGILAFMALRPTPKEAPAVAPPVAVQVSDLARAKSALPALPTDKSIAVLPFANLSAEKDNQSFADGIQVDVHNNLCNIRELRVVSLRSVMPYRDTAKSPRQIAEELNVAYLLDGNVRRQGEEVRVRASLVDARTGAAVWVLPDADRRGTSTFALQSEIAQSIADKLAAALTPQERKIIALRPTENTTAYDLLQQARSSFRLFNSDVPARAALEEQASLLQTAVDLDPKFSTAWAELAVRHAWLYVLNYDFTDARRLKAKQAIDAALHLAPDSPDVIRGLGDYLSMVQRDYPSAIAQFEKLAASRPNDPDVAASLGHVFMRAGRWPEAHAAIRRAFVADAGNGFYAQLYFWLSYEGRRFDDAREAARRIVRLDPESIRGGFQVVFTEFFASGSKRETDAFLAALTPTQSSSPVGIELRKWWAVESGHYAEAVRLERQHPTVEALYQEQWAIMVGTAFAAAALGDRDAARELVAPCYAVSRARLAREPDNKDMLRVLSLIEALLGHGEEALRHARRAVELSPVEFDATEHGMAANRLTLIYAWTGDKDRAVAEAARMLREPFSQVSVSMMRHDAYWFPLRGDPRFEALLNDPKNNAPLF